MLPNNFDIKINRLNTASVKWDCCEQLFGSADVIPMWVADMDFMAPMPVIAALQDRVRHGVFGYVAIPPAFYKIIADWLWSRHRWQIDQEWLMFSPGVVAGLCLLIRCFSEPGDNIIIQPPVYHVFSEIITSNNRRVVHNTLQLTVDSYTIDFVDLEQKLAAGAKMLIFCSPHNPVGRVWTQAELLHVGELCMQYNTLLISDEIHADLVYSGHSHIPTATAAKDFLANTITCASPSKTFNLAGLQTAYFIIPDPALRKKYHHELHSAELFFPNSFGITALEAAYTDAECVDWLAELLVYLQRNLKMVTDFVRQHIPQIKIIPLEGTYLLWLDCQALGMSAAELTHFFRREAKVGLDAGSKFGPGGEGFVRMNIACPQQTLKAALDRIAVAMMKRNF